jgi:predicted nucleic acid-binding protein
LKNWLLDTNVLSELQRPKPNPRVIDFINQNPLAKFYVSSVTFAELRFGIELAEDAKKRSALNDWLTNDIRPMFAQRIIDVDEDILVKWRLLMESGRKIGHTFPQPDLLIASTALHHGLVVVTRNTTDFAKTGVDIFNPWNDRF